MAIVATSTITHWYVDFSLTGVNRSTSGLTPADAQNEIEYVVGGWGEPDEGANHRVWIRRGYTRALDQNQFYNTSDSEFTHQIIGWPLPGDLHYDSRPQAGIDAGWDNDPAIYPTIVFAEIGFDGFNWRDVEVYNIHFFIATQAGVNATGWPSHSYPLNTGSTIPTTSYVEGPTKLYTGQEAGGPRCLFETNYNNGRYYFNGCTFRSGGDIYMSLYFASGEACSYVLDNCEVYQHTNVPFDASYPYAQYNAVFGTPAWYTPFSYSDFMLSISCRNTLFDGIFQNDPLSDANHLYRSGIILTEFGCRAEFYGCTFRNNGGRILGSYASFNRGQYYSGCGNGFHTINVVSCNFEDGYDEPFSHQASWYNLYANQVDGLFGHGSFGTEEKVTWQDDGIANYGLNIYRCFGHPLSSRYVFDCFTYTLWESIQYPRPGGNEFQYVIQTSPDMLNYATNSQRFELVTPEQSTWPCHDNLGSWTIPPDVGNPMTLTVYIKTLNWSVLPDPSDLFFLVHYAATGTAYKVAQRAWSTQSVTQNDQWTALSVTFTPTLDMPLQCRLSIRCYETGSPPRQIILDPAIVVT